MFHMANAVDGYKKTAFLSVNESNPWFLIDLEGPYLIWEIKVKANLDIADTVVSFFLFFCPF